MHFIRHVIKNLTLLISRKKKKLLRNIFRLLIEVSKFFSSLYENYQMYDGKLKSIRDKPNTVKHKLVSLTVDWMTVN